MPNGHEKTVYRDGGRGGAVVASDLDPKFTFDSFVVGPANRLAAAAARRVSDAPGTSYNPLFIYSSSGLGKSHILNSIAHYAARVHPGFGVMYVTVESFLNELTQAIQAGEEKEFRERYQELHILLHLALISLRQGKAHEAIVHFDGMDEATKPTYALLRNRSLAYESLGRYAEALSTLTEAEKLEADDAGLALARGIVQMKSGDGAAAMSSLKVYQDKLGSEKPLPMFYAFSVLAAGLAGDMGRALEIGEEGLKQYPGDGAILVNAGAVFEHRGDGEAATACYERAIKGDSPPPQAFKALGD